MKETVQDFIDRGGVIQQIPAGVTVMDDRDEPERFSLSLGAVYWVLDNRDLGAVILAEQCGCSVSVIRKIWSGESHAL